LAGFGARIGKQRPCGSQTGKTALCRHLFPEHHYVTLDLPSEAAAAEHD
jgi:hypothetical protein